MRESIVLQDGKYEVISSDENGFEFKALRYGKDWQSLVGDNLALAMFYRIQELEHENKEFKDTIEHIEMYYMVKERVLNDNGVRISLDDLIKGEGYNKQEIERLSKEIEFE